MRNNFNHHNGDNRNADRKPFNNNYGNNNSEKGSNFADLMKKNQNPQNNHHKHRGVNLTQGQVTGKIKVKDQEFYVVDIKMKYDGYLPVNEYNGNIGENIETVLVGEKDQYFLLSLDKAKKEILFRSLKKMQDSKEKGKISIISPVSNNKEGYKALFKGEYPAVFFSKEEFKAGDETEGYIVKVFQNGNINLSSEPSAFHKYREGDVVSGTVISLNDYFVFLSIDNSEMEGIVHSQDLSWNKVNFPGEIVAQGQRLDLKILKVQNKCLYLGLKQMQDNPWSKIATKYKTGMNVKVKVVNISNYDVGCELEEGILGSIHVSEVSWGFKKGSDLVEEFTPGQMIEAKIIEFDPNRRRLRLSIKQLHENPFIEFCNKYKVEDIVEARVLHDSSAYGSFLFVEIIPGIDGMLHQSEIDWNYDEGLAKFNALEKDQKVKVKIISIDKEKSRVSVSMKRITKDFFEENAQKVQVGKIYDVEITESNIDGVFVKFVEVPECTGFIKKTDLSLDKNLKMYNYNAGTVLKAKLISVFNAKRCFLLSVKAYQQDENKSAISKNNNASSASSFGSFIK